MVDVCDLSHVCWLEPHLSLSARIPTNGCSMWPRLPQSMATSVSLDFSHGSSGLQRWMSQLTMQKPLPLLWPRHRKHSVSLPSLHICDKQITSPPTFKKRGFNSTWWQDVGGKVAEEHTGQEILLRCLWRVQFVLSLPSTPILMILHLYGCITVLYTCFVLCAFAHTIPSD